MIGVTEHMTRLLREVLAQHDGNGMLAIPRMPRHYCSRIQQPQESNRVLLFTAPVDGEEVYVYLQTSPET